VNARSIYCTADSRAILLEFYDAVMGRWTFDHETAEVHARFGNTHVVIAGKKGDPDSCSFTVPRRASLDGARRYRPICAISG
jgi:hypothetical protein